MKLAKRQQSNTGVPAPSSELSRIRNEIYRLFEDPFSLIAPSTSFFEGWEPNIDIYEDKEKITVNAELPGMKKEDINVSLEGRALTISGERKEEQEHKEGDNYRAERFFGRFQRSITLPSAVNAEKINANYKDGVLTIELPKSEEAKAKQINVKSS
ncbi:Hsp20/alpha crystallin family protein [Pedosphaera parvula]|uniref:Heat shock protein Hsp20 n=1 Tax=Pedosphaera parvula (strain Ellin514) TaxID=320771 RepID=B9XRT7_PEDPL|nr:Hsp20/alpha crystallin family protein [Pedosphaera parvula]EEF57448.1 heat shock protein Hsp20 [Pedosphaera parvula Ellin514]